jgi:hypothetical protein
MAICATAVDSRQGQRKGLALVVCGGPGVCRMLESPKGRDASASALTATAFGHNSLRLGAEGVVSFRGCSLLALDDAAVSLRVSLWSCVGEG